MVEIHTNWEVGSVPNSFTISYLTIVRAESRNQA